MKAIVRKIKDNEWIAEVKPVGDNTWVDREGITRFYKSQQYPIVSPSDKEWLEKNSMDGKEVEGELLKDMIPDAAAIMMKERQFFKVTTPPIHSDPAGEDDFIDRDYEEITKRLKDLFIDYRVTKHPNDFVIEAMRLIEAFYIPNKLSTPQTGREEDYKKLYLQADERATRLEAKLVDLRLQTGRTFSEEEVFKMLEELAYEVNQNGYGGHSLTHPFVKKWFHNYLKQNP